MYSKLRDTTLAKRAGETVLVKVGKEPDNNPSHDGLKKAVIEASLLASVALKTDCRISGEVSKGITHRRYGRCKKQDKWVDEYIRIEANKVVKGHPLYEAGFANHIVSSVYVSAKEPTEVIPDVLKNSPASIPEEWLAIRTTESSDGKMKVLVGRGSRILAFDPPPYPFKN